MFRAGRLGCRSAERPAPLSGLAVKGQAVIHYRTFRNPDPPALLEVWNACCTSRGAAPFRVTTLLEYFTFAKPYFDPAGMILAVEDGKVVGFVHAGFGPNH